MDFNEKQLAAINHVHGPCCVVAGAGSGKTAVLVQRIIRLIRLGVKPCRILAVTFSRKATAEMSKRLKGVLGDNEVRICTFHSLGHSILSSEGMFGYISGKNAIKEYNKIDFITEAAAGTILEEREAAPKQIASWIGLMKENLVHWEEHQTDPNNDELNALFKIYADYEDYKRSSALYDYDDMIDMPVYQMQNNPALMENMRNRFDFILVDEYQDTGYAQNRIIQMIAPSGNNVFTVGDDYQGIYSFRGANIKNILNFSANYVGAKIIYLDTNYRSTPEIVCASNALIRSNQYQYSKNVVSGRQSMGRPPTFTTYEDEDVEANAVVRKIKSMVSSGAGYSDFAILFRINSKSRVFEETLLKSDVPFRVQGGTCFFEQPYIADVIDYLRLALNMDDSQALLRILNRPNRYFGNHFRNSLEQYMNEKGVSARKALLDMPISREWRYRDRVDEFFLDLNWLSSRNFMPPTDLLYYIYDNIGYRDFLRKDVSEELYEERKENADELFNLAGQFSTIGELVRYSDTQTAAYQKYGESADTVTLTTVHKAKGLEYKVVFIVTCVAGMFPHKDSEDLEEERRIMYVAMTRAVDSLEISSVNSRRGIIAEPSPFISEIAECIQVINALRR